MTAAWELDTRTDDPAAVKSHAFWSGPRTVRRVKRSLSWPRGPMTLGAATHRKVGRGLDRTSPDYPVIRQLTGTQVLFPADILAIRVRNSRTRLHLIPRGAGGRHAANYEREHYREWD